MPDPFQFDVFLSHSKADKPRVRRLAERLRAAGLRVWFDEWIIQPGDDIYLAIERGLEASRALVLCLSPAALGSDWVGLERSTALFRDPANVGRRFIPLLLTDCKLPDALRRYKYVDFRSESDPNFSELLTVCSGTRKAAPDYIRTSVEYLCKLQADELQTRIIEPLLYLMAYTHVSVASRPNNRTVQLVATREEFGSHKLYAVIVTRPQSHDQRPSSKQIQQAVELIRLVCTEPVIDPSTNSPRAVDRCLFIAPCPLDRHNLLSAIAESNLPTQEVSAPSPS
jgi:hypothetical protein